MLSCAKNIQDFSAGMTLNEFLEDARTTRAVAFEFTTMGEAARVIPIEIQERYSDIPWGKMHGIRNVLVHEYFRLDEEILWRAVQEDIPPLIAALEKIIDSEK
jgi:uncharacterized protein with HEPN domain